MRDMNDFRDLELRPVLGEFADEFDLDAICDEVTDFDPYEGVVWRQEFRDDVEALNEVLARHDLVHGDAEN